VLASAGLGDFAARSEADYIDRAVALAAAPERLACLRATLRATLAASALMDERGFARRLEATYRTLWRRWCAERNSS